jgi:hypothetical protein
LQALATGEVLNPVVLEFTRASLAGEESVFQRITLMNAVVADVRRYLDFTAAPPFKERHYSWGVSPCPSRKSYPRIAVVQSGKDWRADDSSAPLDGSP